MSAERQRSLDELDREAAVQMIAKHHQWTSAAARQDYIPALYHLGNLYFQGKIPEEKIEEEKLLEQVSVLDVEKRGNSNGESSNDH